MNTPKPWPATPPLDYDPITPRQWYERIRSGLHEQVRYPVGPNLVIPWERAKQRSRPVNMSDWPESRYNEVPDYCLRHWVESWRDNLKGAFQYETTMAQASAMWLELRPICDTHMANMVAIKDEYAELVEWSGKWAAIVEERAAEAKRNAAIKRSNAAKKAAATRKANKEN